MKNNIISLGDQLLEKHYEIHMKNQSLSIRDQHANSIANMPITRNRMLSYIQNDVIKCPKIFCQWFLLDLTLKIYIF